MGSIALSTVTENTVVKLDLMVADKFALVAETEQVQTVDKNSIVLVELIVEH